LPAVILIFDLLTSKDNQNI